MRERGTEIFFQRDGQKVAWPHLRASWELPTPIFARESSLVKACMALHLFTVRREKNMPPPTVRQVAEYIGIRSTSNAKYILDKLVRCGYLIDDSGENERSEGLMIAVNFETVKKPAGIKFPEIEGLTYPKPKARRDQP